MILQNINEMGIGIIKKYREKLEKRAQQKASEEKKERFRIMLSEAKADLILKRNHFENATDEKLLECCIFELTAAEAKFNYYISLARSENMINDDYLDVIFQNKKDERSAAT